MLNSILTILPVQIFDNHLRIDLETDSTLGTSLDSLPVVVTCKSEEETSDIIRYSGRGQINLWVYRRKLSKSKTRYVS